MRKFSGVITALITPFENDKIDFNSLKKLIHFQIKNKINGFVINGTTAESPSLTNEEIKEIFIFTKKNSPEHFPLIVGAGSNSTNKTIELAKNAEKLGADAILTVVPYYNKPPQRGLLEHFKKVADSVNVPIILYNVPSRTITSLEIETIKKLSEHPNIIGIKEASGNIEFAHQIRKQCGSEFLLLSGDDGSYDQFLKIGGDGVISVASHIIPTQMQSAEISNYKDLIDLLFCEANPIPIKMALHLMGIIQKADLRLPLVPLSPFFTDKLKNEMKQKHLI